MPPMRALATEMQLSMQPATCHARSIYRGKENTGHEEVPHKLPRSAFGDHSEIRFLQQRKSDLWSKGSLLYEAKGMT